MKKFLFTTLAILAVGVIPAAIPHPVRAAGCDEANIIFSEIDYDQPGADNSEFLELYLPNAITITDCEIRFVNGSNGTEYNTTSIAGTYSAGKYLWLGTGGDITIGGSCNSNCIQNGDPDGFALVDTSGGGNALVWFYSYEGTISGYDPGDGSSNTSTDLGVSENNNSPNRSLVNGPAAGVGDTATSTNPTPGQPNQDNSGSPTAITLSAFQARGDSLASTPLLATLALLALGGTALRLRRRKTG